MFYRVRIKRLLLGLTNVSNWIAKWKTPFQLHIRLCMCIFYSLFPHLVSWIWPQAVHCACQGKKFQLTHKTLIRWLGQTKSEKTTMKYGGWWYGEVIKGRTRKQSRALQDRNKALRKQRLKEKKKFWDDFTLLHFNRIWILKLIIRKIF